MTRRLREPDLETERLLSEALQAKTANVHGRPDSLAELRRSTRAGKAFRSPRPRRLPPAVGLIAATAAVVLIVAGVNWARASYHPRTTPPASPSHTEAPLQKTGFGYSPAAYFPAVRSDGQPVIVRISDGKLMRILPRGGVNGHTWAPISPMVLSPDGNLLYGVGRNLQEDGKPYPKGWGTQHVVVIDLRTNQFTSLATRDGAIVGMSLSADGTTLAYSLRDSTDGLPDRDVIYVHDLVHDKDRHFALEAGQRVVEMTLSRDGSQLAINPGGNSSTLRIMSTTSGLFMPAQQAPPTAGCAQPTFGPIQWTNSSLYAVRYCVSRAGEATEDIVAVGGHAPFSTRVVALVLDATKSSALQVCDSELGPTFFIDQSHGDVRVVTTLGSNWPQTFPGLRLSGPGT
jgi:hypothetical protein